MNQRTRFASRYVQAWLTNQHFGITTTSIESAARNVLPEITPPELVAVVADVKVWAANTGRVVRP